MAGANYTYFEHWIPRQAEAEKAMLAEFEAGNYTLENPLVKYNPYFINPLAAVVLFKTEKPTVITVTVKGKTKAADFKHTFPAATTHVLPILGLYNDYNNTVELRAYRGEKTVINIPVENVVDPGVVYCETTSEYFQDNVMVISPAEISRARAFDYAGDIRWYLDVMCVFDLKRLKNGNI